MHQRGPPLTRRGAVRPLGRRSRRPFPRATHHSISPHLPRYIDFQIAPLNYITAVCNVKGRSDSAAAAAAVASDAGMRLLSSSPLISISERDYLRAKGSAEQRLQRKSLPFKSCTVVLESRAINLLQVTQRAASARLMMPTDAPGMRRELYAEEEGRGSIPNTAGRRRHD